MSNEVDGTEGGEAVETNVEQNASPVEREYSDAEKAAMSQGWVPEDQYEGTGKWRSAEDFLDRGELIANIEGKGKKIKALEGTVSELKKHYKSVRETEFKRALASLKAEKKEALDQGDTERVVEIDDEIADTKAEQAKAFVEPPQEQDQGVPNPQFLAWVDRNSWYKNDRVMKAAANVIADELIYSGERNPTAVLAEVEKRIKKEFPHKFTNPNREKSGSVEGGGSRGGKPSDGFQLTDEERRVMQKFVKAGVLTEKEYIADIRAQRGEK